MKSLVLWYAIVFTIYHFVTSCGQWKPGDTDRSVDCIDGCTSEQTANNGTNGKDGRNGQPGVPGVSGREGIPGSDGTPGEKGPMGPTGAPGPSGTPGQPGTDGRTGPEGKPGENGSAGEQGSPGAPGATGPAGAPGSKGDSGTDGSDGYSVVWTTEGIAEQDLFCPAGGTRIRLAQDDNRNGIWDVTDRSQSMFSVCNGVVGPAGPSLPLDILDPCGDFAGVYDEVLVRLTDGRLLASFSDTAAGKNTRFSLIGAGSYITTDGSSCFFSVNSSGQLYNEHY